MSRIDENLRVTQRVRVGLTGLAFVFLLVMLAAVFTSPSAEEKITANRIELGAEANVAEEAPKEPLAELGVTPGNIDSNITVLDPPPPFPAAPPAETPQR